MEKFLFLLISLGVIGAVYHDDILDYLKPAARYKVINAQDQVQAQNAVYSTQPQQQQPAPHVVLAAAYKCKINGKTVYTDQPCEQAGGTGGALNGGNVTVMDSTAAQEDILRSKHQARQEQQTQPRVSISRMEDRRSRDFQMCSDLERSRINAFRDGNRDLADYYQREFKRLKCM